MGFQQHLFVLLFEGGQKDLSSRILSNKSFTHMETHVCAWRIISKQTDSIMKYVYSSKLRVCSAGDVSSYFYFFQLSARLSCYFLNRFG